MGLGSDFLKLITAMWDIEEFNMWLPDEHAAIAYLFDRCYHTEGFREKFEYWLSLAEKKDYNEFSWVISQAIFDACKEDPQFDSEEIEDMEKQLQWQKADYDDHDLAGVGFVKPQYVPDWFYAFFNEYYRLEELKRETAILEYLQEECSMSAKRSKEAYEKLASQLDILNEFYFYVKNRRFLAYEPITVKGISAEQLHNTTYLSPVGAYNFLIYLRESPDEALEALKKGLPRK